MLVVTSNWGLTDGTLMGGGVVGRLAHRLRVEVRRAAWRGGIRHDGRYRPIDSVDLVLAGDTFDWLTSREWVGPVKPWQAGPRAAAARDRVVTAAGRRAARLRAVVAGWSRRGIAVPAADGRGRPAPAAVVRVPVRVTALRGDRDRWLDRLPAAAMRLLPGAAVGISWSDGAATVVHGDTLDPLHEACGVEPSLGESLAVDLVAAFGVSVDRLPAVRPLAAALVDVLVAGAVADVAERLVGWLAADHGGGRLTEVSRSRLLAAWNESVGRWHREARRLPARGPGGIDLVDQLAAGLEIGAPTRRASPTTAADATGSEPPGPPVESAVVMLGHGFSRGVGRWPHGVACLAAGAQGSWPPLTVVTGEDGARRGGRLEWLGVPGAAPHGPRDDVSAGRSLRGIWLSGGPEAGRPFIDAA